jgi:hypothetical protein
VTNLIQCSGATPDFDCGSKITPDRELCSICQRYLANRGDNRQKGRGLSPSKPPRGSGRSGSRNTRNAERNSYKASGRSSK